jgi:hypothetical protein
MRARNRNVHAVLLVVALAANYLPLPADGKPQTSEPRRQQQQQRRQQQQGQDDPEESIKQRDKGQNGINVSEPKIYDDALLQQMLRTAEARLAALQVIDQSSILSRLGAVTGATQDTSSFALNVQGAPVPGVTTATKLPTQTTTETQQLNAAGASSGGSTQTVSGLATQDVTTTRPAFTPPTATAPSPTINFPSGFSVSSSDILNEQTQLTAEINGLRLLLAGSLSDYFMKHRLNQQPGEPELPKLRTTLGFNVAVTPDNRYKDAVAIIEVEVDIRQTIEMGIRDQVARNLARPDARRRLCPPDDPAKEQCIQAIVNRRMAEAELPAVTSIIPREKTYNVAAITDKSTSIGGGVATQILGFSGSWLRGHKTYYLVQDQDTVALTFRPSDGERTGFRWQFRPVLGQRYVKAGLKQTFVQLAFPTLSDALGGEIGRVTVHTYWRRYDRKAGILKEVVPGSYREMYRDVDIPSFKQPVEPTAFDATNVEDLGSGQALVRLDGRFLPGTYVRIGSTLLTDGAGLKHEYHAIKFTAPIASLATKRVVLVAQDGEEKPLEFSSAVCGTFSIKKPANPPTNPQVTAVDEANSRVQTRVTFEGIDPDDINANNPLPWLVFVIGQRVFGYSDAPIRREVVATTRNAADATKVNVVLELSAVVPNSLLSASPRLTVQSLFPQDGCTSSVSLADLQPASQTERLILLEKGSPNRFLLYGNNLTGIEVLSPAGVGLINIASSGDPVYVIELKDEQLKSNKQLLLRRSSGQPFLLTIPEVEVKKPDPPKARERVTVGSDEAIIDGVTAKELDSVTFRDQQVVFEPADDKSIRLKGLRSLGATSEAATRTFSLQFKSGAKPAKVDLEVVSTKVETVPR